MNMTTIMPQPISHPLFLRVYPSVYLPICIIYYNIIYDVSFKYRITNGLQKVYHTELCCSFFLKISTSYYVELYILWSDHTTSTSIKSYEYIKASCTMRRFRKNTAVSFLQQLLQEAVNFICKTWRIKVAECKSALLQGPIIKDQFCLRAVCTTTGHGTLS